MPPEQATVGAVEFALLAHGPPEPTVDTVVVCVVGFALLACLAAWTFILDRLAKGRTVLPRQPRRPVPWTLIDLFLVLAVFAMFSAVAGGAAMLMLEPEQMRPPVRYNVEEATSAHLIQKLLAEGSPWVLLLCAFSACVVAPIAEEFFFRVLLQGWLQRAQRRGRRAMPTLSRLVPGAIGPIVLTSFLFGRMHFRVDAPMMPVDFVIAMLLVDGLAKLATVAAAVVIFRLRVGATAEDLGWVPQKFFADVRLGLCSFAALAAPLYAGMAALSYWLPKYVAPDPFVLFFFSVALGILYYRTHRLVPAVMLHMALNVTSLALMWLLMQ